MLLSVVVTCPLCFYESGSGGVYVHTGFIRCVLLVVELLLLVVGRGWVVLLRVYDPPQSRLMTLDRWVALCSGSFSAQG